MNEAPAVEAVVNPPHATLYHRRSSAEPAHAAVHATDAWLDQFKTGTPATIPCMGCPTAVRFDDLTLEEQNDG